jgi:hypothetical protein
MEAWIYEAGGATVMTRTSVLHHTRKAVAEEQAQMAKQTEASPEPEDSGEKKEESTLKVDKEDQQTIAKIATHRGVSIKNLFRQKDVRAFFNHLLLAELEKERLRLEGKPKR